MPEDFSNQIDAVLSNTIFERWNREGDNRDLESTLSAYRQLREVEERCPGSAASQLLAVGKWLSENGLEALPEYEEIGEFLGQLYLKQAKFGETPTASQSSETESRWGKRNNESEQQEKSEAVSRLIEAKGCDWALPAICPGDWRPAEARDEPEIRAILAGDSEIAVPWVDGCRICNPSFYNDVVFLDVQLRPEGGGPRSRAYAVTSESVGVFRGLSDVIHRINAVSRHLNINQDTVFDYLRFFCNSVYGSAGPFMVVEAAPGEPLYPRHRESEEPEIREALRETGVEPGEDGQSWLVKTLIVYSWVLFRSDLIVRSSGSVLMEDDTPLVSDPIGAREAYQDEWRVGLIG